ncbi:MAG: DUF2147 domain-containing protein [Prevotellaceae bacterium]|jgi:uncharacterized protein (DUF2147 family)|nr:DUF2147 domain-containing protein [Prevotellaceae bacterium]
MNKSSKIQTGLMVGIIMVLCSISANAQNITGVWLTENNESKIEIFEQNGEIFGKVIWIKDSKKQKDVGVLTLKNFVIQVDKTYKGSIFAPNLNKNFKGVITVKSENEIEVRGYLAFFSGKQFWKREIKK